MPRSACSSSGTRRLDFSGVTDIGHGFADELFRVFARSQPELALEPVNMSPGVRALVDSVRAEAA